MQANAEKTYLPSTLDSGKVKRTFWKLPSKIRRNAGNTVFFFLAALTTQQKGGGRPATRQTSTGQLSGSRDRGLLLPGLPRHG